jgi:hypothetical protein
MPQPPQLLESDIVFVQAPEHTGSPPGHVHAPEMHA